MAARTMWAWVPNALSGSRIFLSALTWWALLERELAAFVVLVLVIVLTDVYDGPIARRLGVDGRAGANIDSFADLTFFGSIPPWLYVWRPDEVAAHSASILAISVLYVGSLVIGRIRRGAIGFHSTAGRTAATAGVLFALVTILWGWMEILYAGFVLILALDLGLRYRSLLFAPSAPAGAVSRED